jgi:hypothetical protein
MFLVPLIGAGECQNATPRRGPLESLDESQRIAALIEHIEAQHEVEYPEIVRELLVRRSDKADRYITNGFA